MNDQQQREAAKHFAEKWKDKGYEKGDTQIFWTELLGEIFGIDDISKYIKFEDKVLKRHMSFIDAYISTTSVLIEQKSVDKDMNKPIKQSNGEYLTPYEQAKHYVVEMPKSEHPRWIVTCNFKEFFIHDMEKPSAPPEIIKLEDLDKEFHRLEFLVDKEKQQVMKEKEVSVKAGEIVGIIYEAILKQYKELNEHALKSLNKLCVRLVFCLYADDACIFGRKGMFHDYMEQFPARDWIIRLKQLFNVLNQEEFERDKYNGPDLDAFPYVNGGLFADDNIEIPQFTDEIVQLLLHKASENFNWSEISPTIFGAVFESTLNPESRRTGGMHYTSIENIHKVIDPLFLDEIKEEFKKILSLKTWLGCQNSE